MASSPACSSTQELVRASGSVCGRLSVLNVGCTPDCSFLSGSCMASSDFWWMMLRKTCLSRFLGAMTEYLSAAGDMIVKAELWCCLKTWTRRWSLWFGNGARQQIAQFHWVK